MQPRISHLPRRGRTLALLAASAVALLVTAQAVAARSSSAAPRQAADGDPVVLAVHGGAGSLVAAENQPAYREALTAALRAGKAKLDGGASSVDAVEAAIRVLEDSALFNAGKGAVFNTDAGHELDASIMRGSDRAAGAVAGVTHLKNPIHGARLVMEASPHVLMAGQGAEMFAMRHGATTVPQDYYFTERRWQSLQEAKREDPARQELQFGEWPPPGAGRGDAGAREHGTVGAVARDRRGDLAAGTSTGGLTNKLLGRVGDSPIVGAGTYADNRTVAVSSTGTGELFIRAAAAHDIAARMAYGNQPVTEAARAVVEGEIPALGGDGGVIALDRAGTFTAPHSSPGLIHGFVTAGGRIGIRFE
jgi:L-asparaginase / beta-aspartyl-peptidase